MVDEYSAGGKACWLLPLITPNGSEISAGSFAAAKCDISSVHCTHPVDKGPRDLPYTGPHAPAGSRRCEPELSRTLMLGTLIVRDVC